MPGAKRVERGSSGMGDQWKRLEIGYLLVGREVVVSMSEHKGG